MATQRRLQVVKSHTARLGTSQSEKPEGSADDPLVNVDESLAKAYEAADKAEAAVEKVDSLPSAWLDPLVRTHWPLWVLDVYIDNNEYSLELTMNVFLSRHPLAGISF